MTNITWANGKRKLNELIPWEKNPAKIGKAESKRLEESLDEFGQVQTIAISPTNEIYDGHQRQLVWGASRHFGPEYEVDVRISSRELTEDERKKLVIYLRRGTVGELDWDVLLNEFDSEDLLDWGFTDKELIEGGFNLGDELPEDPGAQIDKAEELRVKWGVETGQLWKLGNHRLIVGDCTNRKTVEKVMYGEKANLTFTSPPYWVGKEYETQKSTREIEDFINQSAKIMALFTKKDESRIVINTSTGFTTSFDKRKKRQVLLLIDQWTDAFFSLGWNLRHIRHWLKEGQLMSIGAKSDMIDQHCEWLGAFENDEGLDINFADRFTDIVDTLETFYFADGTSRGLVRGQNKLGEAGKHWALRSYWDDIPGTANSNDHCAAFPLELVERHLAMYTLENEVVFEPFSGSGTTIIGCERYKRKCRAVDLDAAYCAVAIERFFQMTGQQPQLME